MKTKVKNYGHVLWVFIDKRSATTTSTSTSNESHIVREYESE